MIFSIIFRHIFENVNILIMAYQSFFLFIIDMIYFSIIISYFYGQCFRPGCLSSEKNALRVCVGMKEGRAYVREI